MVIDFWLVRNLKSFFKLKNSKFGGEWWCKFNRPKNKNNYKDFSQQLFSIQFQNQQLSQQFIYFNNNKKKQQRIMNLRQKDIDWLERNLKVLIKYKFWNFVRYNRQGYSNQLVNIQLITHTKFSATFLKIFKIWGNNSIENFWSYLQHAEFDLR